MHYAKARGRSLGANTPSFFFIFLLVLKRLIVRYGNMLMIYGCAMVLAMWGPFQRIPSGCMRRSLGQLLDSEANLSPYGTFLASFLGVLVDTRMRLVKRLGEFNFGVVFIHAAATTEIPIGDFLGYVMVLTTKRWLIAFCHLCELLFTTLVSAQPLFSGSPLDRIQLTW